MPLAQRPLVLKSSLLPPPGLLAGPERRRRLHVPIPQQPQQQQQKHQRQQCEARRRTRHRDGAGISIRTGAGLATAVARVRDDGGGVGGTTTTTAAAAGAGTRIWWHREHQHQQQRRPFHSTCSRADEAIDNSRNHYETLKVHPGATPAEIKKAFYTLSKTHHPDAHAHRSPPSPSPAPSPSPSPSQRFMRISEAYSILSIPARRAAYDRDVLRLNSPHSSPPRHTGSYASTSSTNPAGGRPASGLSRRRTAFQGPPPSFYRSGGWGPQAGKRRAAHEDSTGTGTSFSSSSSSSSSSSPRNSPPGDDDPSTSASSPLGGMGPGQDPFGHRGDVPHFDREAHERTGRFVDRRRAMRQQQQWEREEREQRQSRRSWPVEPEPEPEGGIGGMFLVIGGILLVSFLGPFAVSRAWSGGGGWNSGGTGGGGARVGEVRRRRE